MEFMIIIFFLAVVFFFIKFLIWRDEKKWFNEIQSKNGRRW